MIGVPKFALMAAPYDMAVPTATWSDKKGNKGENKPFVLVSQAFDQIDWTGENRASKDFSDCLWILWLKNEYKN